MFRKFARSFQTSAFRQLKVGDAVPSALLYDGAPSKAVNLAEKTARGKNLVIGVPGAFSPGCSQRHIPEYIKNFDKFKDQGFGNIFVIAVNDSFVTSAWEDYVFDQAPTTGAESFVEVLADPTGEFSREWDVLFDATPFFGGKRSARYAAVIEDGKVTKDFIEPDNTGINVSSAENVANNL